MVTLLGRRSWLVLVAAEVTGEVERMRLRERPGAISGRVLSRQSSATDRAARWVPMSDPWRYLVDRLLFAPAPLNRPAPHEPAVVARTSRAQDHPPDRLPSCAITHIGQARIARR